MEMDEISTEMDHAPAEFDLKTRLLGEDRSNLDYIGSRTDTTVALRSELYGPNTANPLHICVKHDSDAASQAVELVISLITSIQKEFVEMYGKWFAHPKRPRITRSRELVVSLPDYPDSTPLQGLKICTGLETAPMAFNLRDKLLGTDGLHLKHIINESGADIKLLGIESVFCDNEQIIDESSDEPLHFEIKCSNHEELDKARCLVMDLVKTLRHNFLETYTLDSQCTGLPPIRVLPLGEKFDFIDPIIIDESDNLNETNEKNETPRLFSNSCHLENQRIVKSTNAKSHSKISFSINNSQASQTRVKRKLTENKTTNSNFSNSSGDSGTPKIQLKERFSNNVFESWLEDQLKMNETNDITTSTQSSISSEDSEASPSNSFDEESFPNLSTPAEDNIVNQRVVLCGNTTPFPIANIGGMMANPSIVHPLQVMQNATGQLVLSVGGISANASIQSSFGQTLIPVQTAQGLIYLPMAQPIANIPTAFNIQEAVPHPNTSSTSIQASSTSQDKLLKQDDIDSHHVPSSTQDDSKKTERSKHQVSSERDRSKKKSVRRKSPVSHKRRRSRNRSHSSSYTRFHSHSRHRSIGNRDRLSRSRGSRKHSYKAESRSSQDRRKRSYDDHRKRSHDDRSRSSHDHYKHSRDNRSRSSRSHIKRSRDDRKRFSHDRHKSSRDDRSRSPHIRHIGSREDRSRSLHHYKNSRDNRSRSSRDYIKSSRDDRSRSPHDRRKSSREDRSRSLHQRHRSSCHDRNCSTHDQHKRSRNDRSCSLHDRHNPSRDNRSRSSHDCHKRSRDDRNRSFRKLSRSDRSRSSHDCHKRSRDDHSRSSHKCSRNDRHRSSRKHRKRSFDNRSRSRTIQIRSQGSQKHVEGSESCKNNLYQLLIHTHGTQSHSPTSGNLMTSISNNHHREEKAKVESISQEQTKKSTGDGKRIISTEPCLENGSKKYSIYDPSSDSDNDDNRKIGQSSSAKFLNSLIKGIKPVANSPKTSINESKIIENKLSFSIKAAPNSNANKNKVGARKPDAIFATSWGLKTSKNKISEQKPAYNIKTSHVSNEIKIKTSEQKPAYTVASSETSQVCAKKINKTSSSNSKGNDFQWIFGLKKDAGGTAKSTFTVTPGSPIVLPWHSSKTQSKKQANLKNNETKAITNNKPQLNKKQKLNENQQPNKKQQANSVTSSFNQTPDKNSVPPMVTPYGSNMIQGYNTKSTLDQIKTNKTSSPYPVPGPNYGAYNMTGTPLYALNSASSIYDANRMPYMIRTPYYNYANQLNYGSYSTNINYPTVARIPMANKNSSANNTGFSEMPNNYNHPAKVKTVPISSQDATKLPVRAKPDISNQPLPPGLGSLDEIISKKL